MTSISGLSSAAMTSPADRMKLQLQSMVSAGSVKSTDQSALSSALDDIDAAMKSSGSVKRGTDPASIKSKTDSLVDSEVSSGKLTDDQATELKQVFAQAAPPAGGPGGPGGAGGPPPPPPSGDDDSSDDDSTTTGTSTTDTSKKAIETLIAFLKQLEQATSSSTNYTASGTSSGSSTTSMLVDGTA